MSRAELLQSCRDAIAAGHARMPVVREAILDADTAVTAFSKLHRGEHGFLLESLEGGERWARYTFMATEPTVVHRYRGSARQTLLPDGSWSEPVQGLPPLQHLAQLIRSTTAPRTPGMPRFTGGAVGFWGYDVVRTIERLPDPPRDDQDLPDAVVMMIDNLLVLDHLHHRAIVIANVALDDGPDDAELERRVLAAEATAEEWIGRLSAPVLMQPLRVTADGDIATPQPASPFAPERFIAAVERCQQYISAGDAFQIVLSRRIDFPGNADPFLTYRWLRSLNPAPYCYFLRMGELTLVGASPEVLVRVEDGTVTVRPIAGTRPRGTNDAEDRALEAELLADPKERAEHRM
ncbi:MAG TPA: chorismate-binding protein, partial [Gemmatimonadales bacterium]|nr:chorismate-binding protein [Gemmatimonadales bacterium]